jgi:hypothetical protein
MMAPVARIMGLARLNTYALYYPSTYTLLFYYFLSLKPFRRFYCLLTVAWAFVLGPSAVF